MKIIQHEDTGRITEIPDGVEIPRRWFDITEFVKNMRPMTEEESRAVDGFVRSKARTLK